MKKIAKIVCAILFIFSFYSYGSVNQTTVSSSTITVYKYKQNGSYYYERSTSTQRLGRYNKFISTDYDEETFRFIVKADLSAIPDSAVISSIDFSITNSVDTLPFTFRIAAFSYGTIGAQNEWNACNTGPIYRSTISTSNMNAGYFTYTSAGDTMLVNAAERALTSNQFAICLVSDDENTNRKFSTISGSGVTVTVSWTVPEIKVVNNFGGGTVRINGIDYASPKTMPTKVGRQLIIQASDQSYQGAMKYFERWHLPWGYSATNPYTVTMTKAEAYVTQTYTAEFGNPITFNVKNNFDAGILKVDADTVNSGSPITRRKDASVTLGSLTQESGVFQRVWNNYAPVQPSNWQKKIGIADPTPINNALNTTHNFAVTQADTNVTYIADMRKNYRITRNDQTEFDGTIGVADATRIVELNSGTVPTPPTKTVDSRTYTYAGWANGGTGSFTPTDNMAYPSNALYKTTHYSNWSTSFVNNNQSKVVRTSDGYLHLVYESMGYVFYERSTNNGTTWQLMNNGKPLSTYEAKHPAISINGTEIVIVYQEKNGTGSKVMLFHPCGCGTDGSYLLESEPDETYATKNLTPVVALGANNEVMIVWKRTTLSGSKTEGLYYKFGHISYDYHYWYSAGNLGDMVDPMGGEVNGANLSPAIDVTKSVTYPARNVFHITWQQPAGNYSHIDYTKIDVGTNNTLSSTTGVEDVSSGSGYQYNYAPSISLSTSNVVNVVWAGMLYYPTGSRKVFSRTRTTSWSSYFGQYGNSVFSPSVAWYGSSSIIAWSETNGSGYSDKFLKWGGVHTANTTGKDLQIFSTTTLQDMRIVSFNGTSSPYSFTQSTDLYTLNKENPLAMRSGVQVVAAQGKTEFYFRIGDISFNGQNVAFKTMNLNEPNLSQKDLDYLMTSDVVNLADADNFGYSIEYGATDTVKALSLLQNNKFISFNVELIDATNDVVLYTLNDVKFDGNSSLSLNSESYNIDLTGLTGKEVYFKVKITNNLKPVYYASEIKSDAKVLGKSKAVNLDLSNKLVVKDYDLFQNYPNPFNPATTITYQLPKSGSVTLKIYDMLGKEVKTLVNENKEMGRYTVQFDASSLASGMYVYQLRANDYTSTKKMLLLK